MMDKSDDTYAEIIDEIGHIQTCGYVLAFDEDPWCPSGMRIVCASDNIVEAPWIDASSQTELLGKDLGYIFREDCVDTVRSLVGRQKQARQAQTGFMSPRANRNTADVTLPPTRAGPHPEAEGSGDVVTFTLASSSPGVYLLEVEPKHGPHSARPEPNPGLPQVMDLLGCIPVGSTPEATAAALCDALAEALPVFDRVMVYRFAEDGSGEVLHESIRPGYELKSSYLNFRFPARDVPAIGRRLLEIKGVSFIADTSAGYVPLSRLEERITVLDLSRSALRAPSQCHVQYLKNMGVRASMVVAILVGNKAWGNLNFHSYQAVVHPSPEERMLVSTATTVAASLISQYEREKIATTAFSLSQVLERLTNHARVNDFLSAEYRPLLRILDIDTIVLCDHSRSVTVFGDNDVSLSASECTDLRNGNISGDTLLFQKLGAKGVAFFFVSTVFVAFLRGSVSRSIRWAGDPDEPPQGQEALHPRASFSLFMETATQTFKDWSPVTVNLLNSLRHAIASKLYADALPVSQQETFAHVSHELRTPFHGVMGSLEMLEAGHRTMDAREKLDIIRSALRCGRSMMSTLDDILDIAKNRHNTEVIQEVFVASSPIHMTMAAMVPFATAESVDLVADTGPADEVIMVVGDQRRIKGIVQNLVNNAIKFTPTGGKVRVSLTIQNSYKDVTYWWSKEGGRFDAKVLIGNPKSDPEGGGQPCQPAMWYVYCVEDSGVGVLPADLPDLVAAYRQVSHGASKSYAGTGLGLHICKTHVEAMSGALGIASTFSKGGGSGGTLFAVVVPLWPAEVDDVNKATINPETAPAQAVASAIPPCRNMGSHKIAFLVVDDHAVNLKLLDRKITQYFKGSGGDVKVLSATDGYMALDVRSAAQSVQVDGPVLVGIFMDIHLPNLDGIECTKRIRKLEAEQGWARITIFGCTADLTQGVREQFQQAGGDGIISKPWTIGQVESACNDMVARVLDAEHTGAGEA